MPDPLITSERMMEIISTMDIATHNLKISTLAHLAENFSVAAKTMEKGIVIEDDTKNHLKHTLRPITIKDEATVIITSASFGKEGENDLLIVKDLPNMDEFKFYLCLGKRITENRFELFKAVVKRIAAVLSVRSQHRSKYGVKGRLKLQRENYDPWADVALALCSEYQCLREKRGYEQTAKNSFYAEGASLYREASFKFTNKDLPAYPSQEVFEKWIKPLKPIVEIIGSHVTCSMFFCNPLESETSEIHDEKPSVFEIMKIHSRLPKIDGPFLQDKPALN